MTGNSPYRLLLYPRPGEMKISDVTALVEPLANIGLLGNAIESKGDGSYYAGDRFMDLVTFLGCSPGIALTPQDGENYCFIVLHPVTVAPRLFYGRNSKEPICRQCKRPQPHWRSVCNDDYCDQCTLIERTENMVWKKSAALARTAIGILPVYPHEAVPSPQLIDSLQTVTDVVWSHAYL